MKTLSILLGATALAGSAACRAAGPTPAPLPAHVLTTQFTYTATVPKAPPHAKALDLWLPLPSDNEFQAVSDVTVDSPLPYKITREAEFGNRMVYLRSDRPQDPLALTVRFTVKRRPPQVLALSPNPTRLGQDSGAKELKRLLKPDAKVPIGGRYGQIAKTVSTGDKTPRDKAHAFFEHVVDTMQYDYKKESPKLGEGDVAFVCDYKKGNCSDLHSYLISLARSSKVPAYLEYGFPITGIPIGDTIPKEGTISGYHCWTWYHDSQYGWVPIDASDARRWVDAKRPDVREYLFGNLITERSAVAFSRGRDLTLSPKQQYGPLNYFIYPYAEADGKPVDAKWDLSYKLLNVADASDAITASSAVETHGISTAVESASSPEPAVTRAALHPATESASSGQTPRDLLRTVADTPGSPNADLQRQIDELRRIVLDQQAQISRLKEQAAPPPPAPVSPSPAPVSPPAPTPTAPAAAPTPSTTASGTRLGFYGFLRLDAIVDGSATNNAQSPLYVLSPDSPNVGRSDNSVFTMHPRLTRFGINYAPPPSPGGTLTGKLEMDWQNGSGLTPDSRPLPRIRHAYLQWQRGAGAWLVGQTWDVISPLFPSPNDDTLMWNAGNIGDRRAQVRYTYAPVGGPFSAALAVGLSGAVDSKDLDANGVRDGEDGGLPNFQTRLAWAGKSGGVGVWGHYATERTTKFIAGKQHFSGNSLGLDWQWKPVPKWDLKGELWTGKDLSDFRGGIGQGVNPTTGREIRASGGWAEAGYQPGPNYRVAAGYTLDDPKDADLPTGARTKNHAYFLSNRWKLTPTLDMGANYIYWVTDWAGQASGKDHRVNVFVQNNF